MDEAVLTGDQAIVRQVYMRAQQQTWLRWQERLPHLLDILEKIPVSWNCIFMVWFDSQGAEVDEGLIPFSHAHKTTTNFSEVACLRRRQNRQVSFAPSQQPSTRLHSCAP